MQAMALRLTIDRPALTWLYRNSRSQRLPLLVLLAGNSLFAGCGILFALVCRGVIDAAVAGERSSLIAYSGGLLLVVLLQLGLRILCQSLQVRVQGRLEMLYKTRLLRKILHKDYTRTTQYHSGDLMNRLTGDIFVVSDGIATILPDLASFVTRLLGVLAVLYIFHPAFALVFTVGGLLLFLAAGFFRDRMKSLHKRVQEKDGTVRSFLQDILANLLVVRTFGAETEMERKSSALQEDHFAARLKRNNYSLLANSGFTFTFSLGYLVALVWCAFGLLSGALSFGTLTAILQLVGQVQAPFAGLSGLLPRFYGVTASVDRLLEIENLPDEPEINTGDLAAGRIYREMRSIEFRGVTFRYDRETVLNRLDLRLQKYDFIAVTGLSGAGKSTFFKLLLGVYLPAGGTISIELENGELIPVDRHTRKLFAYVPQGNWLLSGTIRENLALVNPQASEAEILAAVQVSCAAEFIAGLPRGLDTVIGEKGLGLSEGQAQRLAIARALLCGAPILLLDEATSALDETTEERLLQNLRALKDKTCLIISHKKAASRVCDREIHLVSKGAGRSGPDYEIKEVYSSKGTHRK